MSELFNPKLPRWAITNAYKVVQRDEKMQPIEDPKWTDEQPQEDRYLKAPAFDYFVKMVFENDVNLKDVLRKYIHLDDQKGGFNL